MNDYLNVFRNHYADFSGRARRREYWMFLLFHGIVVFVLGLLAALSGASAPAEDGSSSFFTLFSLPLLLYVLATFVPALALTVRRLHDTGRSGWWYLLNFLPYIGGFILFIFSVLDSEPGANRWGPNPKGTAGAREVAW